MFSIERAVERYLDLMFGKQDGRGSTSVTAG
jgi:hypothetical protein